MDSGAYISIFTNDIHYITIYIYIFTSIFTNDKKEKETINLRQSE